MTHQEKIKAFEDVFCESVSIILSGGPRDGEIMTISRQCNRTIKVPDKSSDGITFSTTTYQYHGRIVDGALVFEAIPKTPPTG